MMKNLKLVDSKYVIRAYDMKGSTVKRKVLDSYDNYGRKDRIKSTLKDQDFEVLEQKLYVPDDIKQDLLT